MNRQTINGVPVEQYGMWCPHGKRIMVPDPADTSDYPLCVFAEPWPCADGCTPEGVAAEMADEADEYEAQRWAEYRDLTT